MMTQENTSTDVVVVGGGLAGLTVAAYASAAGRSVRVLEKASRLGGRAATDVHGGFALNRGPHALYRASEGAKVLAELGVETPGRAPTGAGLAIAGGKLHDLPTTALSLLGTSLLGIAQKATVARLMKKLPGIDTSALSGTSITEFLDRENYTGTVRDLVLALFRLTTFANEPDVASAQTPVKKLQQAMKGGVLYVDGGWQTIVDGVARRATSRGATIVTSARVTGLHREGERIAGIVLADGSVVRSQAVVLACEPFVVKTLLDDAGLPVPKGLRRVVPLRVATLDVGLRKLPRPDRLFSIGLDRPLYYSVHSAYANLAPEHQAMVHVSKYVGAERTSEDEDKKELEALLELMQPGYRAELVTEQWLPRMTAGERLDLAEDDGPLGRPEATYDGARGLYFAGDWVQGGSCLVDATLEGARLSASAILAGFERMRSVA